MMEEQKARPAYVTFELRSLEDREASLREGHYVAVDVVFAIITPQGSKDRIERVAEDWIKQLDQQVIEDRIPREWVQGYKAMYKDFLEGREPAVNGFDVRNWPAISPSQVKALLDARIKTVEDLASANEEALHRLGMGGRALKDRAIEWLRSAKDVGQQAEEIAALKQANSDLQARNQTLEERLARLEALATPVEKPKKL